MVSNTRRLFRDDNFLPGLHSFLGQLSHFQDACENVCREAIDI